MGTEETAAQSEFWTKVIQFYRSTPSKLAMLQIYAQEFSELAMGEMSTLKVGYDERRLKFKAPHTALLAIEAF